MQHSVSCASRRDAGTCRSESGACRSETVSCRLDWHVQIRQVTGKCILGYIDIAVSEDRLMDAQYDVITHRECIKEICTSGSAELPLQISFHV